MGAHLDLEDAPPESPSDKEIHPDQQMQCKAYLQNVAGEGAGLGGRAV